MWVPVNWVPTVGPYGAAYLMAGWIVRGSPKCVGLSAARPPQLPILQQNVAAVTSTNASHMRRQKRQAYSDEQSFKAPNRRNWSLAWRSFEKASADNGLEGLIAELA
jgi:hypothetical protein